MPHTPENTAPLEAAETGDVWSIEGVLIDTDGIPTQLVTDPHDAATTELLAGLKIGDTLDAEGPARPLVTGGGRVIEAHRANGRTLAPKA